MPTRTRPLRNPNWAFLGTPLTYLAFVDLAFAHFDNALDCTRKLLNAKSALEFDNAVVDGMRDQFEAFSDQVEGLSTLIAPGDAVELSFWD